MRRSKTAFNKRGIALFEILVSAAVLSAGCLVLMRTLTGCLRTIHELEDRYAAALAIDDAFWKIDMGHGEFSPDTVQAPGEFQNVSWEVLDVPLADRNTELHSLLKQRMLTLRWNFSSLSLSAYYAQPDSSGT